ncbi:MAG: ADP-ribosylglycohydrolase family protein, partial [Coleofasciculus sp. C2-GNP5-27]
MTQYPHNFNNNTQHLHWLFRAGKIDLNWGRLFEHEPSPLPPAMNWNRIEGMILGLAIGDALGNTTESLTLQQSQIQYGEIRDYLPNRYANYRPVGLPSDDTQLAIWMLEELNANHGLDPDRLAQRFTQGRIFGIGSTVKGFLRHYKRGLPWFESGPKSAGNGALMRIAPIVIPHQRSQT